MKVLHVIPSIASEDGGPSFAMPLIARGLRQAGIEVDIATTNIGGETCMEHDDLRVFSFRRQTEFYKVSLPLSKWLSAHIDDYDLIHIHALFSYASYRAATISRKRGVPYIIRPAGVLNRWGMENRRPLLKRFSFRLIERRILRDAAAIHYTSAQERTEAGQAGAEGVSVVSPIGLDLQPLYELPEPDRFLERFPQAREREIILFLSRLDPKKGLDLLIRAFAEIHRRRKNAILVIAGDGHEPFVAELRKSAGELDVAGQIVWTGHLVGDDKLSALAAATLFVLPSYSENFGIAAVEALAAGVPCVISDQVAVAFDVKEYEAGLIVPCETQPLALAMESLLSEPELGRRLGDNARRLAEERFSLEAMTGSLLKLYDQVLIHSAARPREPRITRTDAEASGVTGAEKIV